MTEKQDLNRRWIYCIPRQRTSICQIKNFNSQLSPIPLSSGYHWSDWDDVFKKVLPGCRWSQRREKGTLAISTKLSLSESANRF